jgi:YD repeat-containing protein
MLCAGAGIATLSSAATTTYEYDALGRLRQVTHDNGNVTTYTLDAAGNRTLIQELAPQTAPASISVPAASTTGSYSITWTAGGTVAQYELYESTSSSFSPQTRVFSGTGTSASISGHGNGTFYYRVRGCNGSACTNYRTGGGVVVTLPPGAPPSISVPPTNNTGNYSIGWTAASGTMTAYELYESVNSNFSGESKVYDGTALSKSYTSKPSGTYYYRVRACNGGSCSGYAPGGSQAVITVPPSAVPYITVPQSTASSSFTIQWDGASGTVTAYELYESSNASFTSQVLANSGTATNALLTGRTSGTYYYRVRACNMSECGGYATGPNGILVDLIAPTAPGTPSFSVNGTNVSATFTASSDNVGVTGYEYSLNGSSTWTPSGSLTTINMSGLTSSTSYAFQVRARDGVGNAGNPASNSFVTGPPIPGVPAGLSFTLVADCTWSASWSATTHAAYYRFADTQVVERDVPGTSTTVNCPTGNSEGIKPKWVKACNATGCGGQANFGAPIDVTPPTTPGAPQFSNVTSNSATVSWGASFDLSGIANYEYNIGAGWMTIGSTPNVALISLTPSTNYTFQVRARDNATLLGNASSAPFSTPAAPDTTPPTAPLNLQVGTVTSTNAPASWGHASDNVGVTGYEYSLNGGATWTNLNYGTSANIPVTGGTSYTLLVRARDGAGNTGTPASKSFSAPPPIPGAPTGLSRWNPAPSAWTATWNHVSGSTYYQFMDNAGIPSSPTTNTVQYQCTFNNCPNNRPKWVQACNSSGCGAKSNFAP